MKKYFRQMKRLHKNSILIPESLCRTYFQNPTWLAIDYNIEPISAPPPPPRETPF